MRFQKNVPAENREFLREQLKKYKREIVMTREELRELEQWVARGRSPYDNGDYIYSESGYPLDFVSAMRFQQEQIEWFASLSDEEREIESGKSYGTYDAEDDNVVFYIPDNVLNIDPDEELPFS